MEVRSNCNTTFGSSASPQSHCSSRSGQSRELQKFLSTQPAWVHPEAFDDDDDDFLTATWHGDTLVGKDGESVVGSVEPVDRKSKSVKTTKQTHETSTLTKKPQRRPASEQVPDKARDDSEQRRPASRSGPESEAQQHRGQVLHQMRQRHGTSRSPVPIVRKSLNRAKSERFSKQSTSLDTHLTNSKEISRHLDCDPPGAGRLQRSKSLSAPVSPQESTITDLTDEDGFTSLSRSSSNVSNNLSHGSLESDPSRRSGLQRAHSECLLKALRQKTKAKMAEIEEDQEYAGPLRNAPNSRTRRSCSPTSAGGRSRSPRHAARPHNPLGPNPQMEGPIRMATKANALHRERSLSPSPEEDTSPPAIHHRRLSRAMSERIQLTAKVNTEHQRFSLHRAASKRGLNKHPSMTQLAVERTDSLREVFDWNGRSSSSSSLLSDDCTRSQSSCGRSQSSQLSRHSSQGRRAGATDTSPPMPTSLKRCSSSDFPKNTTSSRRGSVGTVESVPLETSLSQRKLLGPLIQLADGSSGRFTPRSLAGEKVLSRRPSLRRMASNSSIDRRELLKRTGSNSSIDQYQITPTLRRSSSYVNRQAAHSLFYDNLRISQRDLYEEVAANNDAAKTTLRVPCSKEEAMTFHGILKDVSASKQIFNSMLSK